MSTICTKTLHFFFVSDVKNKDSTLLAILITKVLLLFFLSLAGTYCDHKMSPL